MTKRNFDVVVLSSVEWDAAWQRHHAFAAQWATAGHRVFFVENTGARNPRIGDLNRVAARLGRAWSSGSRTGAVQPDGVKVISPLVLPPTNRFFSSVNARWLVPRLAAALRARGLQSGPVVFVYLPTETTFQILDRLDGPLVVYDCADNVRGLPSPPLGFDEHEAKLIKRAILVLTTSRTLFQDKKSLHANVLELHHGVNSEFFLTPQTPGRHRRIAYFGTLWSALDYSAVRALADAGFQLTLIGPEKEPPPPLPSSIRRVGRLSHTALPGTLKDFDCLILPYVDNEYNRGVIPAKVYECLATGRPVLASPLPALKAVPELAAVLRFARTPDEWVSAARALDLDETAAKRDARIAVARDHSEESAFSSLMSAVERARAGEWQP